MADVFSHASFLLCVYLNLAPIIQGDSIIGKHHLFFRKIIDTFWKYLLFTNMNSITN